MRSWCLLVLSREAAEAAMEAAAADESLRKDSVRRDDMNDLLVKSLKHRLARHPDIKPMELLDTHKHLKIPETVSLLD